MAFISNLKPVNKSNTGFFPSRICAPVHDIKWSCHDLLAAISTSPNPSCYVRLFIFLSAYLCHHSAPCYDIRFALRARVFLKGNYCIQKRIQMFICKVVKLLKILEATVQICGETRWIIIAQGGFVEIKLVLIIIRETGNFLCNHQSCIAA